MTIVAAVLCQAPCAHSTGVEEGGSAAAVTLGHTPSPDLFAFQDTTPRTQKHPAAAPAFTHAVSVLYTGLWGTASNKTEFSSGVSTLDWPMDSSLVGGEYRGRYRDIAEFALSIQACPWTRSVHDMKDSDTLDDAAYGYATHDGVDIYSESATDSKAFVLNAELRAYPLSYGYASVGLITGWRSLEMDFKTYDLRQTGYGSWTAYTMDLPGPISTYNLTCEYYTLGLTWRLKAGEQASLTVDTAIIPYARVSDEDEHLRRFRSSETDCDGSGTALSVTGRLALTPRWFVSTSCSRVRITADGHQKQYWWGNDPGAAGNETGTGISGIDAKMKQDSLQIGLSLGCSL